MTLSARAFLDAFGLKKLPRLRIFLKRAYCRMIDPFGRGRRVPLTAGIALHMPTYFATAAWSDYEEDSLRACVAWLQRHPDAVFADVGCSIAIYSLMALQVSPRVRVFAFDADTVSLKTTAEFCRFADMSRLALVHGFVTDCEAPGMNMEKALASTRQTLALSRIQSEPTAVRYLCLDRPPPDESIPRNSLDGLLLGEVSAETPMLIKIDVEGAELIVLRGASRLLLKNRPAILLSVHPQFLASFQQTVGDIAAFLGDHGYGWANLNTDHEEHWWCDAIAAAVSG
jgi:FkbM family methyltransferase